MKYIANNIRNGNNIKKYRPCIPTMLVFPTGFQVKYMLPNINPTVKKILRPNINVLELNFL